MKQKGPFAPRSHALILLILTFCANHLATLAQIPPNGTVIPTVCYEPKPVTLTTTLTQNTHPSLGTSLPVSSNIPAGYYTLILDPGGANEERLAWGSSAGTGTGFLRLSNLLAQVHMAGETVVLTATGEAVFGYHNTASSNITIPRSISSGNFFTPGFTSYAGQPNLFLPGRNAEALRLKIIPGGNYLNWVLNGTAASATVTAEQGCANVTYQGRLSDAGTAANGEYDLRFTAYDALTDGTVQTNAIIVENAQVTNGIFTVQLFFGSTLNANYGAKYLEIAVRPGSSSGTAPFTVLTPRQPITSVPYSVNAANALNAANSANSDKLGNVAANQYILTTDPRILGLTTNLIQNTTSPQTANINITGTITSGCRAGFTAIAGGRLCVSAMQSPVVFVVAVDNCRDMKARVGNSADVMLTFSEKGFNYFGDLQQGWLADHMGQKLWGTWNISFANADFDGPPAANGINGVGPKLPYRCVY